MSSIQNKLALLVAALVLATAGGMMTVASWQAQDALARSIDESLHRIAIDRQLMVMGFIRHQLERAALVASRTRLRTITQEFVAGRMAGDAFSVEARAELTDAQSAAPNVIGIALLDAAGRVIAASCDTCLPADFASLPEVRAGLKRPAIGLPFVQDGQHRAWAAVPGRDAAGKTFGVFVFLVDPAEAISVLQTAAHSNTLEVRIAARDRGKIRQISSMKSSEVLELTPGQAPVMDLALSGQSGFTHQVSYRGIDVLAAYRAISPQGWGLVVSVDAAQAYAPVAQLRRTMTLVGFAILAGSLLVSYLVVRRFVRPMRVLAGKAAQLARGDFATRAEVTTDDEVGRLATAFNEMATQLGTFYERLETQVRSRTQELEQANAQLNAARDIAVEASRMKSDFVANMSHEIRTPMNAVIGMTNLLADTPLDTEQKSFVSTLRQAADNLLALINDILDLSKIEAGRLALESIPFSPAEVATSVIDLLALRAREKDLELIIDAREDSNCRVMGDEGRVRQVLMNLVGNAIKFTEKGQVLVEVRCTPHDGRFELDVRVTDSGIGMDDETLARLFTKFTQADASTTRRYGGTGLGLAISKHLVEMMGGTIGAKSKPGEGSQFWIKLPLSGAAEQPERRPPPFGLEEARVLIVDDNAVNRKVLSEQLASWQMKSNAAASGAAALEALRDASAAGTPFHIAILDQCMPEMDGLELGRSIRGDQDLSDTILVMLSSVGNRPEDRAEVFAAWVTKPVRSSALMDALARAWGGPPNEKLAAAPASRPEAPRTARRVLVVEDNPMNQMVATKMLEKLGCRVDIAADGREAIAMVSSFPYAIVFMDCQMPEMDGYEATRMIRKREAAAHTPIVGVTAHAMAGDRERCLASGMDDYLTKPVTIDGFAGALERWAGPKPPPADFAAHPTIDRDRLGSLFGMVGGDELVKRLVIAFEGEAGGLLAKLRDALAAKEAEALRQSAHSLRGSGLNLGLTRLAQMCGRVEDLARASDFAGAAPVVEAIPAEIDRAKAELASLKK
jgi:signal transduction histidine kinase/CheY-like chemotaxis protein